MKIAIAGADGAGKSSVCSYLSQTIDDSTILYAGKREFILKSTKIVFLIWKKMRFFGRVSYIIGQYFLYYPFEYIENYAKFIKLNRSKSLLIYDRHPIDRVMMKYELKRLYKHGLIKKSRFVLEYPLRLFWAEIYVRFFPNIDQVYVLLPDSKECYRNAHGQYKNHMEAHIRVMSYKDAYTEWNSKSNYFQLIDISKDMSIKDISEIIINKQKGER